MFAGAGAGAGEVTIDRGSTLRDTRVSGRSAPVHVSALAAPADLLPLHAAFPERYPFLLESTAVSGDRARYDILFAFPEESLDLNADWRLTGPGASTNGRFLGALDDWWSRAYQARAGPPPFVGGWFLFLGYELAQQIEPSLRLPTDPTFPVARAVRVPVAVIRDRLSGQSWIVAERGRESRAGDVERDLSHVVTAGSTAPASLAVPGSIVEEPAEKFLAAVRRAQTRIAAGDIYQANLSRTWTALLPEHVRPWMVYERLRRTNPAPFAGLAVLDDASILCSSPERLLNVRDDVVATRPIAGTRPRHDAAGTDEARRAELIANAKERAEHVMLIDLERNDLGRICQPGTVRVSEFMVVESFAHVHHIVSNVTGNLRPGTTPGDVIRAVFPGGTITGCPKVRCIGLIRDFEDQPRGAYTGAMGYLNRDGSCDLNILIRTMTTQGRHLALRAGSGIVADSDPERELEETRAKAKGMLLSLQTPGADL